MALQIGDGDSKGMAGKRKCGNSKVSHIESLDYEINENDLFKHDWRTRSKTQVLQYIFLKWVLAFLVGLLTGGIATLIKLAIENIAGYKLLAVGHYINERRYMAGFTCFTGINFLLTLGASFLCVWFAPTAGLVHRLVMGIQREWQARENVAV